MILEEHVNVHRHFFILLLNLHHLALFWLKTQFLKRLLHYSALLLQSVIKGCLAKSVFEIMDKAYFFGLL